jgi:hypothetical protein
MAGLVPAIHVLFAGKPAKKDVDARHEAGMTKHYYFAATTMISIL